MWLCAHPHSIRNTSMTDAAGRISTADPHQCPAQVPRICEYGELSLLSLRFVRQEKWPGLAGEPNIIL